MTLKNILNAFHGEEDEIANTPEWYAYFHELCQEAIRICMELNNSYHTPEELREIMSRLIGKKVDDTFRLFPPFYTDFGKNISIGKDVLSTPAAIFKIKAALQSGTAR